jgi:D-alanyl-lipoteichoic acid acyltransferase DltB (MBOAT superfamily)
MAFAKASALFFAIYDVDTVDTRLTTPAGSSYRVARAAVSDDGGTGAGAVGTKDKALDQQQARARARATPPRWRSPEFYLYYVVGAFVLPYMFWVPYSVSRPSDPRYHKFERLLSPGWIPGRRIDNSDAQYHLFRENILYLLLLLVLHPLLRRGYNSLVAAASSSSRSRPSAPASPRSHASASPSPSPGADTLAPRLRFDAAFAVVYLFALHGFSALKILAILGVNYRIAKRMPRAWVPAATWAFNVGILFANELGSGYRFAAVGRALGAVYSSSSVADEAVPGLRAMTAPERLGAWMDSHKGLISRWEILFNITVLRLISFNMDHYWSQDRRHAASIEKQLDVANLSERDRVAIPAPPDAYTFQAYLGYAIYAPLYLTGPIITFNDFVSQSRHKSATIERRRTTLYAVRWVLTLLAMEVLLHFNYIGAISKSRPDFASYLPSQLTLLSYFNLHVIWLKLLIPWRLARLWALVDGIDPPENMLRCVSNNYSTLHFWRAWHRSYNRWLVRYLFVPLGGSSFGTPLAALRSVATYAVVFTFVALWHDIQLNLLVWGWMIVLFMLPEMVLGSVVPPRSRVAAAHPTAYRMATCAGGVLSVFTMVAANLVGFAFGIDGLRAVVGGIVRDASGVAFLLAAGGALFVGIQIMFEVRQDELRRGIDMRC